MEGIPLMWQQLLTTVRAWAGWPPSGGELGQDRLVGSCSTCGTRLPQQADRCPNCGCLLPLQRFMDAVAAGDVASVQAQLAHDPRLVNATAAGGVNRTPLHRAATLRSAAMAHLLLDHGGLVNARDSFGATPLHMAAEHNSAPVVALLLDRGAALHARTTNHRTPC